MYTTLVMFHLHYSQLRKKQGQVKWYDPGLSYVNWFVKDSSKVTSYKTTLINSIRKECISWHRFHNVETVKNLCYEIRRTCFLFKLLTLIHSVQFPRYLIKKKSFANESSRGILTWIHFHSIWFWMSIIASFGHGLCQQWWPQY